MFSSEFDLFFAPSLTLGMSSEVNSVMLVQPGRETEELFKVSGVVAVTPQQRCDRFFCWFASFRESVAHIGAAIRLGAMSRDRLSHDQRVPPQAAPGERSGFD